MNVWHAVFGYAGLIPFIGLTALMLMNQPSAEFWLMSYAALIFSFLGGVQWLATLTPVSPLSPSASMSETTSTSTSHSDQPVLESVISGSSILVKQAVSVGVMLWAWLWLIVPQVDWFIWAGLSFWGLWLYERLYFSKVYPSGFMTLRRNLSLVAGACLLVAGIAASLQVN